jgi:hypothetical protein
LREQFRIGDVFEVTLDNGKVGYFQYIAVDATQLSSAVIRAFAGTYDADSPPKVEDVFASAVGFHAHVFLKAGRTLNLWRKVGSAPAPHSIDVIFRNSGDYGDPSVKLSQDWYVWRINEPAKRVGRLPQHLHSAEIGVVKAPQMIAERIRTGSYGGVYPGY